jgi:hypothetical protein
MIFQAFMDREPARKDHWTATLVFIDEARDDIHDAIDHLMEQVRNDRGGPAPHTRRCRSPHQGSKRPSSRRCIDAALEAMGQESTGGHPRRHARAPLGSSHFRFRRRLLCNRRTPPTPRLHRSPTRPALIWTLTAGTCLCLVGTVEMNFVEKHPSDKPARPGLAHARTTVVTTDPGGGGGAPTSFG